jgi:hypothetical protein
VQCDLCRKKNHRLQITAKSNLGNKMQLSSVAGILGLPFCFLSVKKCFLSLSVVYVTLECCVGLPAPPLPPQQQLRAVEFLSALVVVRERSHEPGGGGGGGGGGAGCSVPFCACALSSLPMPSSPARSLARLFSCNCARSGANRPERMLPLLAVMEWKCW